MTDYENLLSFTLNQARQAPVELRPSLYRGLARICGNPDDEKALHKIAHTVEITAKMEQTFAFNFHIE